MEPRADVAKCTGQRPGNEERGEVLAEVCCLREQCARYLRPSAGSTQNWRLQVVMGHLCDAFIQSDALHTAPNPSSSGTSPSPPAPPELRP